GAGLLGLKLHVWLPEKHAPDRAREMIGAMTGLLGLLLALVLGTLVGSSYTLYATQKSELETLDARILQLDAALEAYGPEAQPGREGLRKAVRQVYDKIWGSETADLAGINIKGVVEGQKLLDQFLMSLAPKTDAQKQLLATANVAAGQIEQTRLLMMLQLAGGISWPMVGIVVCWSLLLFCGYGLVSPVNATVIVTLGLGAVAVASAIFMIIELGQPYSGWFRIPSAAATQTLQALGA
ncbi:MAG: hypothetical protein JO288_16190, partial [Hyphomicrobiales bacterium]|nr:hypothetical protein [Hyphomicrobiales bacterium]